MNNKMKKSSINTVIWLLLAAMLVCVVMVSAFTAAFRRRTGNDTPQTTESNSTVTSPDVTQKSDKKNDTQIKPQTPDADKPESKDKNSDTEALNSTSDETVPAASVKDEEPVTVGIRYFVIPAAGTVSKSFEIDIPVYSLTMNDYRAHTGVDIAAPVGTDVISASNGTVCRIWNDQLMGRCVTIDHGDGIYTSYMNLAEDSGAQYKVGDKVAMGQSIGAVGESALIEISEEPHLHLEMKVGGVLVDPLEYMGIASPQETVYGD